MDIGGWKFAIEDGYIQGNPRTKSMTFIKCLSNHYSVPDNIEMLIAVAYSLRYERLKNLKFSIENT